MKRVFGKPFPVVCGNSGNPAIPGPVLHVFRQNGCALLNIYIGIAKNTNTSTGRLQIFLFLKKRSMNPTLVTAILFINLALVLYTIGVWAERLQKRLKWWHLVFFWSGFAADTIGTTAMSILSGSLFEFSFHGITGNTAILLMLIHAVWATIVLARNREKMILNFHRFSVIVWIIWLVPMITGGIFGVV